ncbi:MAG: two-component regulator propeller domain-containing protein [Candidatus Cloacimonadota bacterium]|nr:two-component regulator propeller domain-containing protein [Candidatus Cloacimonadota bacterium]
MKNTLSIIKLVVSSLSTKSLKTKQKFSLLFFVSFWVLSFLMLGHSSLIAYEAEVVQRHNWEVYTNTTHIHQIFIQQDMVFSATWGGVSIFDTNNSSFSELCTNDGLLRNEIHSVHYIEPLDEYWFGVFEDGISRYKNGEFLSVIQENQGVDANFIFDIANTESKILVGTDNGLIMFDIVNGEYSFLYSFGYPEFITNNNVNSITIDDSNRIWIATDDGINYVNVDYDEMMFPENWGHINDDTPEFPLDNNKIKSIEYYNGKIYLGSENGIALIDNIYSNAFQFEEVSPLPAQSITDLKVENDSVFWAAFGKWDQLNQRFDDASGVARFSLESDNWSYQHWTHSDSLYDQISDIEISSNGTIWAASWGEGIFHYSNGHWEKNKSNCISSNIIGELMFDSRRNLWCGFSRLNLAPSSKKGTSKFTGTEWINYKTENSGIGNNTVYSLAEDKFGNIWFGHWGGANTVSILNKTESVWQTFSQNEVNWLISGSTSLLQGDEQGNMWIGGYAGGPGGVTIVDSNLSLLEQFVPPPGDQADMLTLLINDDMVWVGGFLNGISNWEGTGFPSTNDPWDRFNGTDDICCKKIVKQEFGNTQGIYAAGDNGLYTYDEYWEDWYKFTDGLTENVKIFRWETNAWEPWYYYFQDEEGNPESRLGSGKSSCINDIFIDQHGRKWLATDYGISMLDPTNLSFTNFTTENSDLPTNRVLSFAYDPYSGKLYAGTNEGLCALNIGISINDDSFNEEVAEMSVFPNPFKPEKHDFIYFQVTPDKKLPAGNNKLFIYSFAGDLIAEIEESDHLRFFWDGKNGGKEAAGGVYFYVVSSEYKKDYLVGKFAIVR